MQLTNHFTLEEFETSQTAKRLNIENKVPDFETLRNLYGLCLLLERIRIDFGGVPIKITSGYRCPELNRAVGGVSDSQHILGQACDFVFSSSYDSKDVYRRLFNYLRDDSYGVDQCIFYTKEDGSSFIHLSSTDDYDCRHEFLRYVYTSKGLRKTSFPVDD